jgi:hypothetical protein
LRFAVNTSLPETPDRSSICKSRLAGERIPKGTAALNQEPGSPASRLLQWVCVGRGCRLLPWICIGRDSGSYGGFALAGIPAPTVDLHWPGIPAPAVDLHWPGCRLLPWICIGRDSASYRGFALARDSAACAKSVGAGLLANAVGQAKLWSQADSIRGQARSYNEFAPVG